MAEFISNRANNRYTLNSLPDGWEIKSLREIAEIDTENLSNSTPPDFKFNYISLEQVDMGRLTGYTEIEFGTAPSRARRVLRYDDVLMSTVRPNLMAHLHYRRQVPNAVCSTGFSVIRAKRGISNPGFIFAHLFGKVVAKQIDQILVGSNYPAITSSEVGSIRIPCPSDVREQRAIAAALSDMDGLLDSLDALIAKKQAVKEAAMQQLLTGKTRLPGFGGEWETKLTGELGKFVMGPFGSSIKVETFVPEGVPIISGQHLHNFRVDDSPGFNFITDEHAQRLASANVIRGDVVFTHAGSIGQVAYIPENSKFKCYVISQRQFCMRCDQTKVIPEFVSLYFRTPEGQHQLLANASRVGVPSIAQPVTYLRKIRIPLPSLPEQRAIAAVLSNMDNEISALERRREKTEAVKRGMMQELLTGRVRLAEAK